MAVHPNYSSTVYDEYGHTLYSPNELIACGYYSRKCCSQLTHLEGGEVVIHPTFTFQMVIFLKNI